MRPVESKGPVRDTKKDSAQYILETIKLIRKTKDDIDRAVGAPRYSCVQSKVERKEIRTRKQ